MFYSDDPVWDYERYCDYCEKQNKQWHSEHDDEIENKIDNIKGCIKDLQKCNTIQEIEDTFYYYELEWEIDHTIDEKYSYEENVEEITQEEIRILELELKDLQKELEN